MKKIRLLVISLFLASSGVQAEGFLINKDINKDIKIENYSIILKKKSQQSNIMNNSYNCNNENNCFNKNQSLLTLNNNLNQVSATYQIKEIPLLGATTFIENIPLPNNKDLVYLKKENTQNSLSSSKEKSLVNFISNSYKIPNQTAEKIVISAFKVSKNYKIDPVILLSITAVESKFNPKAHNGSGAIGLVQALPSAHPEKIRNIRKQGKSVYDIESNLDLGAQIYSEYLNQSNGNVSLALQRYNGSYRDTKKRYSKKVFKVMKPLEVAYNNSY